MSFFFAVRLTWLSRSPVRHKLCPQTWSQLAFCPLVSTQRLVSSPVFPYNDWSRQPIECYRALTKWKETSLQLLPSWGEIVLIVAFGLPVQVRCTAFSEGQCFPVELRQFVRVDSRPPHWNVGVSDGARSCSWTISWMDDGAPQPSSRQATSAWALLKWSLHTADHDLSPRFGLISRMPEHLSVPFTSLTCSRVRGVEKTKQTTITVVCFSSRGLRVTFVTEAFFLTTFPFSLRTKSSVG